MKEKTNITIDICGMCRKEERVFPLFVMGSDEFALLCMPCHEKVYEEVEKQR